MNEENIIPENLPPDEPIVRSHKSRYYLARGFINKDQIVVDAACGCGYGSEILSKNAKRVIGLDYDSESIIHAKKNHKRFNNSFALTDLSKSQILLNFDVAVSIETIEHIDNFRNHLNNLKKAKKIIICSVPIIPTVGINLHHKHDFKENTLINEISDEKWQLYQFVKQDIYGIYIFYNNLNKFL